MPIAEPNINVTYKINTDFCPTQSSNPNFER
jgi:hypothetical protein